MKAQLNRHIYAVQQDTQSSLMIEFIQHMLARHCSDLTGPSTRAFLQAVCAFLVCGTTVRTTRHVLPLTKNAHTACKKRS